MLLLLLRLLLLLLLVLGHAPHRQLITSTITCCC
jgi:hypothetical protein